MTSSAQRASWAGITACFLALLTCTDPLSAAYGKVTLARDTKDPRWLSGEVLVDAPPADVIARVAQVDQWNRWFSDVKSVRVVARSPNHWHVRLDTRTMDCGEHDYHITVKPGSGVDLVIDAPGLAAHGSLTARAVGAGKQSVVTFRLFIDTTGVMGWFIPERTVRKRQERMVRSDLQDLARLFAPPRA